MNVTLAYGQLKLAVAEKSTFWTARSKSSSEPYSLSKRTHKWHISWMILCFRKWRYHLIQATTYILIKSYRKEDNLRNKDEVRLNNWPNEACIWIKEIKTCWLSSLLVYDLSIIIASKRTIETHTMTMLVD